jgi:cytoskeletal protein CcmA (bactofilin family)
MTDSRSGGGKAPATVIARGVRVEGEFKSEGDVLIEGEVHGNLTTTGQLTVGPEARIKADVHAAEAVVSGTVQGNVGVTKRLELKSTAKVTGDVTAETVSIEPGATISGKFAIGVKMEAEVREPAVPAPTTTRSRTPFASAKSATPAS